MAVSPQGIGIYIYVLSYTRWILSLRIIIVCIHIYIYIYLYILQLAQNHPTESGRGCAQGWWQLVSNCCKYNEVAVTICLNLIHVLCVKTVGVGRCTLLAMFLFASR